jgi:hypothetical protein
MAIDTTTGQDVRVHPARRRALTAVAIMGAAILGLVLGALVLRDAGSGSAATDLDLDGLAVAWASGDADQIRAFYTEDAVIMPFGHIVGTLHDAPAPEYWDVSGPDLEREAAQHKGATLEYLEAAQVGDIVVATARWTFPEGFTAVPPDSEITNGDIFHLRDGLIWRQFTDFQAYTEGELVPLE